VSTSLTTLLTVDQFDRLPNPSGGYYELRHGEAVFVSFPDKIHKEIQRRIREFLIRAAEDKGVVDTEFPYRPYAEHELWSADVAYVSQARYDAIDRWLLGSPDLVIEVRSPSNTDRELQDKAMVTLAGGCKEFWIVDGSRRIVTVHTVDGISVYTDGQAVPVRLFGGQFLVRDIFGK
jgi:Uma2 family endonuclease